MEQQTALVPTLPGIRPGDEFALKDEGYRINNWRQILAIADDDDFLKAKIRYVRIFNGVATLAANHILIRSPINLPNGFYELSARNTLVFSEACEEDAKNPLRQQLGFSEEIGREHFHLLMNWVNHIRSMDPRRNGVATIGMDEKGFWYDRVPEESFRIPRLIDPSYAVDLPITKEAIFLDAFHLKLALVELTRYHTVVIGHAWDPDDIAPLFIGRNWSQCCLLAPKPPVNRNPRTHG